MYDFNSYKTVAVHFMAQVMVCLGECSFSSWEKMGILLLFSGISIHVNQILLVDFVDQIFYNLADFPLLLLSVTERWIFTTPAIRTS